MPVASLDFCFDFFPLSSRGSPDSKRSELTGANVEEE